MSDNRSRHDRLAVRLTALKWARKLLVLPPV